jgi:YVTN family beta-propeller protein
MSLRDSSGAGRLWTARRALIAGSAAAVIAAGTTVALTVGHPTARHVAASGSTAPKTARLASADCSGPAGAAYIATAGYQAFDAIDTANCTYIQNYNVGDPQVPGFSGDYDYSSEDEAVAIHGDTLYFADTGDDMVSIINAATLNPKNYNPTETDINVGINPGDVAVTPDGSQLWVADTGPQTGPGSPTDIKVISLATDKVTATLPLSGAPAQIAFSPSGGTAYVTTAAGLWNFNTATDQVSGVIQGLGDPHGVVVSPDGSTVYVTDTADNAVDVINAATNEVTDTIPVGQLPWGMALSKDGGTLYVADPDSNGISVIDTATDAVTATIPLAGGPDVLALTPNGSQLWVTGITSAILTVYDTSNNSVVGALNLGGFGANSGDGLGPTGMVLTSTPPVTSGS